MSSNARVPALAAALAALVFAVTGAAVAQGAGQAVPVTVVTVEATDVLLTSTLPGRVVASAMAEVRPQVDGIIMERTFDEGEDVALGEPLYTIDAATYRARVASAGARVAEAEARLRAAEREAVRVRELIARRVTSEQALDEAIASRDAAAAAVELGKADLLTAEIDLERTTIKAPLSGVIGRSLTTRGALVTNGQPEPLAVIRTLDPVLVDVTQSAAELVAWRRGHAGERPAGAGVEAPIVLILADGSPHDETGSLKAAEPHVDELTGVVTLRLEFPNPDRLLLPGMYVQVKMPLGVAENVVLAPQEGVMRDRRGRPTAFVVDADDVIEARTLDILQARDATWIVSAGLETGDRIVVEGLQKVRPGTPVAPVERAAEPVADLAAVGR